MGSPAPSAAQGLKPPGLMVAPADASLARVTGRLPRWVAILLAAGCVGLGGVIITRPATSLSLLIGLIALGLVLAGILAVIGTGAPARPVASAVVGVAWVLAGTAIFVWPGLTTAALALVVGVTLLVGGLAGGLSALRAGTLDERISGLTLGAAGAILGVLALLWPDVTLLLVGVVFGGWLIMQGLAAAWNAVRGGSGAGRPRGGPVRRWLAVLGSVGALLIAGGAGVASWTLRGGTPEIDDFYLPPRELPGAPGTLLRSEPFARGVPANARAWRILYTTTRDDDTPAVASGIVVVPDGGAGRWPVVNLAHGTTGVASTCAPSLAAEPFEAGAFFVLDRAIDQGWAVVATDYIGLGTEGPHPYLIGDPSGRAVLDASRAARQLAEADLGRENVVWGHSQGGGAALWTGGIAARYAPELEIAGVAALAPASDLPALIDNLPAVTGGSVFAAYVLDAYTSVYPEVSYDAYVQPGARLIVREMGRRCLTEPGVLVSVLNALALGRDPLVFASDPGAGALGARLAENVPTLPIPVPVLLAQGEDDSLVTRAAQAGYVAGRCAAGQQIDYRSYAGRNHVPLVEADSPLIPELLEWTRERFAGVPVSAGCTTSRR